MDKNSKTWKEIISLNKNSPSKDDEGSMLRSLGLDDKMLKQIEEEQIYFFTYACCSKSTSQNKS